MWKNRMAMKMDQNRAPQGAPQKAMGGTMLRIIQFPAAVEKNSDLQGRRRRNKCVNFTPS